MADKALSKGELTREALMNAGFRVFKEKGFLRAQIGDIVREAGKSSGVFHIYFKNKENLLDAWIDRADLTVPWIHADTNLLFEKARYFILQSYWSLYESYGPILEAQDAAALVNDHFAQRLNNLRQKFDESIARTIRHAQSEGRIAHADPELSAVSIAAMITRTTAHWFRHRTQMEARGFDQFCLIAHLDRLYVQMLDGSSSGVMPAQAKREMTAG